MATESPYTNANWRKSSYSTQAQNCVEVTGWSNGGRIVGVRDSTSPDGGILRFREYDWSAFIDDLRPGK